MRSNSGSGKSNNGLRDPTMKEHETARREDGKPARERADRDQPAKIAPAD